jgi:putative Mn2+ efflux pump MntP
MSEAQEGSETAQQAREGIEAAQEHLPQRVATRIAIMIGVIAVAMTALQFTQRGLQEAAETKTKMASDLWAFYETKTVRVTALQTAAMVLEALPGADRPEIQDRIKQLHANEAQLRDDPGMDGMKQLVGRAQDLERQRDAALADVHRYAFALTILQAVTVVASAAVAVRTPLLAVVAGVVALIAVIYAVGTNFLGA